MDAFAENVETKREKNKLTQPHRGHEEERLLKKQKCEKVELNLKSIDKQTRSIQTAETGTKANTHRSPKKRLELPKRSSQPSDSNENKKGQPKQKFIYGNYNKYYGYRNKDNDFQDIRLHVFETHHTLFENKLVLDIGCNSGFITLELAKRFPIKHITGIDIDRGLISQATKYVTKNKKASKESETASAQVGFPFNIGFMHANYVLRNDVLLEIEREQFDVILCLSVTKWIHLNFGDDGLKQSFRRMFLQLRAGGQLILEAQPFDNYGRRKKITETIFSNYKSIKFFPKDFTNYLLSSEVGFKSVSLMGVPDHCVAGFKRPIQIFNKE